MVERNRRYCYGKVKNGKCTYGIIKQYLKNKTNNFF